MPSASGTLALWTCTFITSPSVSTKRCRFLPSTCLAGSKPRSEPPYAGGPHRLGIHYGRAGLGVPTQPCPQGLAQRRIETLPGAVDAPGPEPMVDGPPGRKLAGQKAPGAAALEDVEDGVQDLTRRMDLGAPSLVGGGQMLLDVPEFFLGKVCGIAHHGPKRRPSTPTFRIYQTVSPRTSVNKGLGGRTRRRRRPP